MRDDHLNLLAEERELCKSEIERLKELLDRSHQQGFSDGCLAQRERCAQVAETYFDNRKANPTQIASAIAIAAAIRALKDEP
jgi:hypothetical protein